MNIYEYVVQATVYMSLSNVSFFNLIVLHFVQ